MKTKKIIAAIVIAAAGTFGAAGMADAATGVVNVNAILAQSSEFKSAQQSVVAKRDSLQKSFADKSKNMSAEDRQKRPGLWSAAPESRAGCYEADQ